MSFRFVVVRQRYYLGYEMAEVLEGRDSIWVVHDS
jgi:hypothetical protein